MGRPKSFRNHNVSTPAATITIHTPQPQPAQQQQQPPLPYSQNFFPRWCKITLLNYWFHLKMSSYKYVRVGVVSNTFYDDTLFTCFRCINTRCIRIDPSLVFCWKLANLHMVFIGVIGQAGQTFDSLRRPINFASHRGRGWILRGCGSWWTLSIFRVKELIWKMTRLVKTSLKIVLTYSSWQGGVENVSPIPHSCGINLISI